MSLATVAWVLDAFACGLACTVAALRHAGFYDGEGS